MDALYRCSTHQLWERETGILSPLKYRRKAGGCEDLVRRLKLASTLEGHDGCVNTVNFNPAGDLLVSGSDDCNIVMWDWAQAKNLLSYSSGHTANIFQARVVPYSDNKTIVSCAADGQVRCGLISEAGTVETRLLGKHARRAQKLALFPGSPCEFLSCGEDGVVNSFDLREKNPRKLFTCRTLGVKAGARGGRHNKIVELYSVYINPSNRNYFAVGGTDEFARVYDIRKLEGGSSDGLDGGDGPLDTFAPKHLIKNGAEKVHVTSLAFSHQEELLVSYNDELIYLFQKDQGLGDNPRQDASCSPGTSASLSSSSKEAASSAPLSEQATPHSEKQAAPSSPCSEEGTSPCASGANGDGQDTQEEDRAGSDVDDDLISMGATQVYKGHRNSKTIKGVNFLGPRDEYVMSGSDCGHIFIWRKKDGKVVNLLEGDSSVVNAVESHPYATVLATSGIETNVKIWTPTEEQPFVLSDDVKKVMAKNAQQREERSHGFGTSHLIMHMIQLRNRARSAVGTEGLQREEDEDEVDSDDDEEDVGRIACPIS